MKFTNRYHLIIQARLGSQRLPGKVLKPIFNSLSTLDILIDRFKDQVDNITVATTVEPQDTKIVEWCKKRHVAYYKGSETNVLQRFIEAANQRNSNNIIRVCADNPLIDLELCNKLIQEYDSGDFDYVSYSFDSEPTITFDHGIYCEIVSLKALNKILKLSVKQEDLEHVTSYIYHNKDKFKIKFLEAEDIWKTISPQRLTIDTDEDLSRIKSIFRHLNPLDYSFNKYLSKLNNDINFYNLNKPGIKK